MIGQHEYYAAGDRTSRGRRAVAGGSALVFTWPCRPAHGTETTPKQLEGERGALGLALLLPQRRNLFLPRSEPLPPAKRLQARACSPSCLLALGAALLAVGAALVATPLALHAASGRSGPPLMAPPPPAPPTGLDAEGVPLDAATQAADQQDGELIDCGTSLSDREAYQAAAASAEASLLGSTAAELPQAQLLAAVAGLPPLLFGTVFWVLVSEGHPWKAPEFPAAAAAQVGSAQPQPLRRLHWPVLTAPPAAFASLSVARSPPPAPHRSTPLMLPLRASTSPSAWMPWWRRRQTMPPSLAAQRLGAACRRSCCQHRQPAAAWPACQLQTPRLSTLWSASQRVCEGRPRCWAAALPQ